MMENLLRALLGWTLIQKTTGQDIAFLAEVAKHFPTATEDQTVEAVAMARELYKLIDRQCHLVGRQDDGFGLCPVCHQTDGYANAGRSHRAYCKEHRVSWLIGANLFSDWRDQTEEEQRAIWEDIGLSTFKDIVPFFWPETLARAERERSEVPDDAVDEHPF
jgi:hypothetical protein